MSNILLPDTLFIKQKCRAQLPSKKTLTTSNIKYSLHYLEWLWQLVLYRSLNRCSSSWYFIKNSDQNSPNLHKLGLYPEQLSGTAFVAKRHANLKTWLYKLRPTVVQGQYVKSNVNDKIIPSYISNDKMKITPNQLRYQTIHKDGNQSPTLSRENKKISYKA